MRIPFFSKPEPAPPSPAVVDGFYDINRKIGTQGLRQDLQGTQGFFTTRLSYDALSRLVDFDWLSRRVVRALVEAAWQDALIFAEDKDREHWERINYIEGNDDGAFLTAAILARTHGASLLIKGFAYSGSPEQPIPEGSEPPIDFLIPVAAPDYEVQDTDLNQDADDPEHYGLPEYYRIEGNHRYKGLRIHRSRVVHFAGPAASSEDTAREPEKLVGLSVLDPVIETIQSFGLSWSSVTEMMKQASIPIWTLQGLISGLASGSKEIAARFELQQEMLSSNRAVLLDAAANESYRRESVDFASIPQVLQQLCIQMSAAGQIPVQELFGRIISGLGETGKEDSERWQRQTNSYRTRSLKPRIDLILGSDVEWEFAELGSQEPRDFVSIVKEWWNMGMITDQELRTLTAKALTLPDLTPAELAELLASSKPLPPVGEEGDDPDAEEEGDDPDAEEEAEATSGENPEKKDPNEKQGSGSPTG